MVRTKNYNLAGLLSNYSIYMTREYDIVVIGAGSGGLTTAVGFAKAGKSVLLVEREHMGGECTNSGCVPSKALLHVAKKYHQAVAISGKNDTNETYRTNALEYVRDTIAHILAEETPETFEKLGITVVSGEATFTAPCTIKVANTTYRYNRAVIATGSSPRMIDVPGIDAKDILTNQNVFQIEKIPERLLVVGAGPIGMELGQAFALLGSKVTIASIDDRFAKLEDPAISPLIEKKFTELGITIITNAFINRVENKQALFDIKTNNSVIGQERIAYNKVLVAIGRTPNLPNGLAVAGITATKYGIAVDSQYRTSNKYVYALGDVSQRLKFTHTASDTARQVITQVLSKGLLRVNNKKAVPKVTYTLPEIASVGISYEEASAKYNGSEIMRLEVPYTASDRAVTDNNTDGLMVVTVRRLTGTVLGANIIGHAAGEIISVFTLAIDQKISMWKLRSLIYAYPTYTALVQKAGDTFFAQQLQSLKADIWAVTKKHLPKIIAGIFWLTLIYNFQHYRVINSLSYTDVLLNLVDFFTTSMWGPLVYIVAYALRPLILFPATLLTALSGVLFGFWGGLIYTLIGENMSANLAYWIGRFFGQDLRLEDTFLGKWVTWLRDRPFESVLFMRLFYMPFDLANYGSGVLRVQWSSYALATLIGILPGLTTFVALGAALDLEEFRANGLSFDALDVRYLAVAVIIFTVSLVLSRLLKKWKAEV